MTAWWKRLAGQFAFTPVERTVVLTLVGAFVAGLGIRIFRDGGTEIPKYDYAKADSVFAARSAAIVPGGPTGGGRSAADTSAGVTKRDLRRDPTKDGARPALAASSVDLNRATKGQLMKLPGVGEVIAERILLYREEHGGFAAVADLTKVKGIGKKKLEKIAPFCFVEK